MITRYSDHAGSWRIRDITTSPLCGFLTWIKFKVLAYKLRLQMPAQE